MYNKKSPAYEVINQSRKYDIQRNQNDLYRVKGDLQNTLYSPKQSLKYQSNPVHDYNIYLRL